MKFFLKIRVSVDCQSIYICFSLDIHSRVFIGFCRGVFMDRAVIHCFVEATIEFRLSKTLTLFYYIRVTMGLYVKVFTGLYRSYLWIKSIYMYVPCFVFVFLS